MARGPPAAPPAATQWPGAPHRARRRPLLCAPPAGRGDEAPRRSSGILTTSTERLRSTAPADQVTLVSGRVYGYGREAGDETPTLYVVPASGEAATVVQTFDTRVDEGGSSTDVRYLQVSFELPR